MSRPELPPARKSLGQHFLVDRSVGRRIVEIAGVVPGTRVLEIGPGRGALSRQLLMAGARLTVIEKDRLLVEQLRVDLPEVRVIEADAVDHPVQESLEGSGWICVSNLPYNVGTLIISRLIRMPGTFERLVMMVQREVALRLCAKPASSAYGALSLDIQAWASASLRLDVPPGAFQPRPKVDSAVVELLLRERPETGGAPPARFHETVKVAFAYRRKTLRNNFSAVFGRERAEQGLAAAGIDPQERAERLDAAAFGLLSREFFPDPTLVLEGPGAELWTNPDQDSSKGV